MQLFSRMKKVKFAVKEDHAIEKEELVSKEANCFEIEYHRLRRSQRVLQRWIVGLAVFSVSTLATIVFLFIEPSVSRSERSPIPACMYRSLSRSLEVLTAPSPHPPSHIQTRPPLLQPLIPTIQRCLGVHPPNRRRLHPRRRPQIIRPSSRETHPKRRSLRHQPLPSTPLFVGNPHFRVHDEASSWSERYSKDQRDHSRSTAGPHGPLL